MLEQAETLASGTVVGRLRLERIENRLFVG
jgi:hypothetical protein